MLSTIRDNDTEPILVTEMANEPGQHSVCSDRHMIVRGDVPLTSFDRWQDGKEQENRWVPGKNIAFIPAGTKLTSRISVGFAGAAILLRPDMLTKAAAGLIEPASMDLDYRRIVSPPTAQLVSSLRGFAALGDYKEWPMLAESSALALGAALARTFSPDAEAAFRGLRNGLTSARAKRVMDYIDDNISRQITVAELAGVAALSPYHFARSFRRETGMSPVRYVSMRRAEVAKRMLENKAMIPLADVALQCGFCSQAHMTTVFKRLVGVTPGEYRRIVVGKLIAVAAWLVAAIPWSAGEAVAPLI